MNLVDLGTNVASEPDSHPTTIVLPRQELLRPFGTNRPPPPPRNNDWEPRRPSRDDDSGNDGTNRTRSNERLRDDNDTDDNSASRWRGRRRGEGRFPFGRPFWMSEEEYRALRQKKGVHSFVLVLSTRSMQAVCSQDLWGRLMIGAFATVSVVGFGLAWRNLTRSSELEVRLARAAELNTRLKEMNLAAAGLAHETRNPLNIIRGLAHLIARQSDTPSDVHSRARDIVAETDRVTAQLNEFINYSRPREIRWTTVALDSVVNEVVRALASDTEEHAIRLQVLPELPAILGDEQLLRQALFNLLINAIQAVGHDGNIAITGERSSPSEFRLEVRDDGPGVAPENRMEIFKPYFTTHPEGTGLGLAIVQQIVLAHGWEIECLPNSPRGAVFRLSRMRLAGRS
jgi:signal transduction histidine kinase